jgi:hypothetical protein
VIERRMKLFTSNLYCKDEAMPNKGSFIGSFSRLVRGVNSSFFNSSSSS